MEAGTNKQCCFETHAEYVAVHAVSYHNLPESGQTDRKRVRIHVWSGSQTSFKFPTGIFLNIIFPVGIEWPAPAVMSEVKTLISPEVRAL